MSSLNRTPAPTKAVQAFIQERIAELKHSSPEYRATFLEEYPEPPWICFRCGKNIWWIGHGPEGLQLHHLDGDHSNNDPANIVPMHGTCHQKEHGVWRRSARKVELRKRLKT